MSLRGNGSEMSEEEMLERQREMERQRQAEQTANQIAAQEAAEMGAAEEGYWDVVRDPDISSGIPEWDDHLAEFLAVEMSGQFATGNIRYQDWKSFNWRTEQEFWVAKNEFRDRDAKLDDLDMLTMFGEKKPRMTDKMARRLRNAQSVKKMLTSLSVDARGLRSGTEIHTVSKTENTDEEEEGGRFSGVRNWLSG